MSFYEKMRRQKFLTLTLMLFMLSIGIVIGTLVQTSAKAAKEQTAAADATPLTIPKAVPLQNEFTRVAKELEPSVVNISIDYIPTKTKTESRATPRRRQQPQSPDDDDQDQGGLPDLFQRFFGQGGGGQFQFGEPDDQPTQSLGSGVVVDRNGYILTTNHVVEKATRIKVKFMNDDTEYPGTVVGTDKETDLAVIHVDRKNLPAARIGNSDALQPGDWTVAIGSPFGFQATGYSRHRGERRCRLSRALPTSAPAIRRRFNTLSRLTRRLIQATAGARWPTSTAKSSASTR